jgi:RHS repeat-associated protein
MKLARLLQFFAIIFATSALLCAQTAPNTENGFKSFGSYDGSSIDTVNLENGNLMLHIPLFSYLQRGELGLGYSVQLSSKQWQVGQYYDTTNTLHYRWMLGAQAGITLTSSYDVTFQRGRTITTDLTGNQTEADFDYAIRTRDGAVHWLSAGVLANGNMVTLDGSNFQFTLTRGTKFDHSDDSGVLKDSKGNTYNYPSISNDYSKIAPASGTSANLVSHVAFTNELMPEGNNTIQTFNDVGLPGTLVDANGNIMNLGFAMDPVTTAVIITDLVDGNGNTINFASGPGAGAAATANCPTLSTASGAYAFSFPGPNGKISPLTICYASVTLAPTFSQPNVGAPKNDTLFKSFPMGSQTAPVGGMIMPDGAKWAFSYDDYGNITTINLPTGGVISYAWTEIPLPACQDGNATAVSRAVLSRTVNDLVNPPQVWQYTWGTLQPDGSITNYVRDPNGNETAHVFKSPVNNVPCAFYETETRTYQGTHQAVSVLKTVDTHYVGVADGNDDPTNALIFASRVVADTVTTTLPGNQISQIVRQYDGYPNPTMFAKLTDEKVYDYGTGGHGALLRETSTTYQWQSNSAYLNAGFLDLPASVIVTDGSGCKMAETDYAYDEAAYPNGNYETTVGSLPTGTHQAVSTPRGNLTTVTRLLFDHSTCNPATQTSVSSHTRWYDTGEAYQQIDSLGYTTTHSYDPAYAGAYATRTCSPQTGNVTHCVSGTYDFITGLLDSLTNENATTQASGNTAGDSGHTSSYSYDPSWRLTSATAPPDPGNGGASAQTLFTFSSAAPFTIQRQRSITTAMSDVSTTYLDAVGRPYQVQHAMPGGPAKVDTVYDGVGQPVSVSNPYFTTSDATYGVTQSQYDGLGRATQITKQDGSISSVSFNANCATAMDEGGNQRRSCSDALGRLIEVDEPGVANIGTQAQTTVDIGAMNSVMVGGHAAANATGSITISGVEQFKDIPGQPYCAVLGTRGTCLDWEVTDDTFIYDNGTVGVLVNGQLFSYAYSSAGDSVSTIANSLAGSIRASSSTADYSSVVVNTSATPPTATIFLTARNAGAAGNSITLSVSATTYNTANFAAASFNSGASGAALMGGIDAYAGTQVTDSGNVSISVGSFTSPTVSYGLSTANNTGPQVAAALAAALAGSGFTANVTPGSTVLTIKDTLPRVSSNGLTVQVHPVSSDPGDFPGASFNASGTLSGGVDQVLTALGNVTLYQYDGLGNLLCVEQHGGVTGTGCSALPASDASSPWRVRRFTYDSVSRLLAASNPESGTITYSYDADGNLLQKTSPAPNQTGTATQTVSYCYDALHRVTGKGYGAQSCPLAAPAVTYAYDSGTNAIGHLTSLTDQAGTASYTYDILGRLATETRSIASVSKSTAYSYNLDGSVKTLTYPSGRVVTYTPDSAGRLVSAVDGNGTNYVTSASYNPDSSLKSLLNGSTPALNQNLQYTPRLQLCRITTLTSGTLPTSCTDSQNIGNIMDRGYDFHAGNGTAGSGTDNGNVFGITNYRDTTRSQSFTYDALNRLTSGWSSANTGTYSWGENYSIDAWGNLQVSPMGGKAHGGNFTLSGNSQNRPTGLSYDAAGNLMSYLSATYAYDQENRLSSTAGMSYTYDGNGERVLKSNTSTGAAVKRYWSMGGNTLAEGDGSGNLTAEYIYFGSKRVARIDLPANTVHYYLSDHLGSTSIVASVAGAIQEESDYSPFGIETIVTGPGVNELKFTGKRRDAESQLDYFGARYYSNIFGRFATADEPFADQEQADPQSWNLYSYVRNSPLIFTDANGRDRSVCSKNGNNCALVPEDKYKQFLKDNNLKEGGGKLYYVNPDGSSFQSGTTSYVPAGYLGGAGMIGSGQAFVGEFAKQAIIAGVTGGATSAVLKGLSEGLGIAAKATVITLELNRSAASALPDLTGLTREAARDILEENGFKNKGTTPGGYEKWYHPDGSRVQIRPDGEIVRTGPKVDGYRPRIDAEGNRTDSHNTGERVQ